MKLEEFKKEMERLANIDAWPVIKGRILRALDRVLEHDHELLEDGRSERAVAHRLAVYLEQEFPGWHADCEFNRQGDDRGPKRVSSEPLLPESHKGTNLADVNPDIIIHRRRTGSNLLAIEVKPSSSKELDRDRAKLRKYLSEQHLKYEYAVLVIYHIGDGAHFEPLERIQSA
jgi:hypothetical protein